MFEAIILGTAHPHIFGMASTLAKMDDAKLIGVWDDDADRLKAAADKLQTRPIASLDEALASGAKLALSAAVPSQRAELACKAVAAGIGIVVDKPLAVTHEALDAAIAAVQQHQRPIMTYYPYRGSPHVLAARKALKQGRIGKLVRVYSAGPHKINAPIRPAWHWTRAENGGCLIDIGAHHFDLCCWMADAAPQTVSATHGNFAQPEHPEFQDFAQAVLQFPSGAFGHVEVDWLNPTSMKHFGDTRIWLQGTTGKIEIRLGDEVSSQIWTETVAGEPLDISEFTPGAFDAELYRTTALNQPTPLPQADVWRTARLALEAFESAQSGGQVRQLHWG